jgi:hypothetical protein
MASVIYDPKTEGAPAFTKEEASKLFEQASQRYLKMSASEFLDRLDSGYFSKHPNLARRVDSVLFYLPLIRR